MHHAALRISLAAVCVLALLLDAERARSEETVSTPAVLADRAALPDNCQSGSLCRLVVETGPGTIVDRGPLGRLEQGQVLVGAFRLWREPGGRMLYLYDDAQNLVGRIVNPGAVILLGAADGAN